MRVSVGEKERLVHEIDHVSWWRTQNYGHAKVLVTNYFDLVDLSTNDQRFGSKQAVHLFQYRRIGDAKGKFEGSVE